MKIDVCKFYSEKQNDIAVSQSEFAKAYNNVEEWGALQSIILGFAFVMDVDYDFTIDDYNSIHSALAPNTKIVFSADKNTRTLLVRVLSAKSNVKYCATL